ncbi:MAG: type III-A CRISPR-associated RAMP protein Csm5 [Nitrospirota bacterium]
MNLHEQKTAKLRALTPIFIGNGESIKPFSYLLDGNTVHVIDEDKFFAQLSSKEQELYQTWTESIIYPLDHLNDEINKASEDFDKRRQLIRKRREIEAKFSLWNFIANILKTRPLPFVNKCEAYAAKCNVPPEQDGFRLCMKDIAQRLYVPGTEIKGALRTAMLYALVSDSKNYPWLRDKISEISSLFKSKTPKWKTIRNFERIASNIEARMLRGEKEGLIKDDAKFDFLRMIYVSDSTSLDPNSLRIELTQMIGTRRYTKTWVETISSNSEVSVRIGIGNPAKILKELGLERFHEWISFPKLLEACYIRSKDILEEEARFFVNELRLKALISQLQRENKPDAPVLRIGQGQGFLGVTINLSVKKRDQNLYDEVIRKGVTLQRRWRTEANNFPKTRRVITNQGGAPTSLLGWGKIML